MSRCRKLQRLNLFTLALLFFLSEFARAQTISEFMAINETTLADGDGNYSDWIELYNPLDMAVSLVGWYLTDDGDNLEKWPFPESFPALGPGEYLLVFASGQPTDNYVDGAGHFHTNFRLNGAGEYLALVMADGQTVASAFAPSYPQQSEDVSYGESGGDFHYLSTPTPGLPNGDGSARAPQFSHPGGLVREAFNLELSTAEPAAEIRITFDGSVPTVDSTLYTEPLILNTTTQIRAKAFVPVPGRGPSPTVTRSYLFLEPELDDFSSNIPLAVIDSFGFDINSESGTEGNRPDFPRRPVWSVFIDAPEGGRATLTDVPEYSGRAGMKVRGFSSRHIPKKQYSFEVWDEDDNDKDVALLEFSRDSDWVFHAPYADKTLMRNHLAYKWWSELGYYGVGTRFVEVFFNWKGDDVGMDDYVGVYVFMEKIKRGNDRVDISELKPSDLAEPEISGGYIVKHDFEDRDEMPFQTARGTDFILVEPDDARIEPLQKDWIRDYLSQFESALYSSGFADPETGYRNYFDFDSLLDYHILTEAGKNTDSYFGSIYMHKDRSKKLVMGPLWDWNTILGNNSEFGTYNPEGWLYQDVGTAFWYNRLFQDAEFLKERTRRWFELRETILDVEKFLAQIDEVAALLEEAQERNFKRWPILGKYIPETGHLNPEGYAERDTYQKEVNWMKEWVVSRFAWIDSHFLKEPEFSLASGRVAPETQLHLSHPNPRGEIVYTLNGPDPKLESGEATPEGIVYQEPIVLSKNTRVRARVRVGGKLWSEPAEAVYAVSGPPLAISEIMFNPPRFSDDTFIGRSNYEFIEFQNVGDEPIDMTGVRYVQRIDGMTHFDFAEHDLTTLAPGEYVVIVNNLEAFRSRYGDAVAVAGEFSGRLVNDGDTIIILGPLGEPFITVSFESSWYPSTDGEGHSLVLDKPAAPPQSWSSAESWRPSLEVGGSPGRADTPSEEGLQLTGDITQDSRLNIGDAVGILRSVVGAASFPCGTEEGNQQLLDTNSDGALDFADGVHLLSYLFLNAEAKALGTECIQITGCPTTCGPRD